ncbi:phosphotransferase [Pacificimonas flava]
MSEPDSETVRARLSALLSASCGADIGVHAMTPLSGGAASMSYALKATRGGEDYPMVLQQSFAEEGARSMSRAVQAAVQTRAGRGGVPVPDILLVLTPQDGLGDGFVMAFVEGETLAPRYLRQQEYAGARAAMTDQTATALARLHSIDTQEFAGLGLQTLDGPAQLQALMDSYDALRGAVPVFELAFAHLKRRLSTCSRPALVHGDFRSGNFIIGGEGLRSVLDWELAHFGDPLLDIGWLCTNTWRFGNWRKPVGGFGEREAFYRAYERAGGEPVDPDAAAAFEMLGSLRWGIMCMQMAAGYRSGETVSVERAAIGRRVSEAEADIVYMLREGRL